MDTLKHTRKTETLLKKGKRREAVRTHNQHVASEFEKAKQGEVINLTDLMAARELFENENGESA